MYKKILFPTDGSKNSKKALEHLIAFAQKFHPEIDLVFTYSLPVNTTMGTAFNYTQVSTLKNNYLKYGQKILKEVKQELKKHKIDKVNISVFESEAGIGIAEYANENDSELIIMGSRGLGTVKSLVMGSVSNYVLHHVECPVIVIH